MKTAQLVLALAALFAGSMKASTQEQQIVDAVSDLFTALATEDIAKFRSVTSREFYIFDGGVRFDGDKVVDVVRSLHAAGKRFEWKVTDPDIHIEGNTAWIAYVNKGSITDASGTSQLNWLESGFLRKRDGTWEIVFLHSTRVPMKPEQANGK